jgi:hypothetical protein
MQRPQNPFRRGWRLPDGKVSFGAVCNTLRIWDRELSELARDGLKRRTSLDNNSAKRKRVKNKIVQLEIGAVIRGTGMTYGQLI